MRISIDGKHHEVKKDTRLQLKDGSFATVIREYNELLIVKDDLGQVVPIQVTDIAKVIEDVIQTVSILSRVFKMLKSWFS